MTTWTEDVLGGAYQQFEIDLGEDPDGEGDVVATLVRHRTLPESGSATQAVIYVHGFTDYFFNTEFAEFFTNRGVAFYALDLRKCGRSRREGHTPHYVSDLALYDAELEEAVRLVDADLPGVKIAFAAHSTGGIVVPLWLDRVNQRPGGVERLNVNGVVLNSPWFDLQGDIVSREVVTPVLRVVAPFLKTQQMPLKLSSAYGRSLHVSTGGEWDYDLDLKPLNGFPTTFGWINAVRRGHAQLHHGLDIGVPSLVQRSSRSHLGGKPGAKAHSSDIVLDVRQIAKWAGCLGNAVTSLFVPGAMHDIFLSAEGPRAHAYEQLGEWWDKWIGSGSTQS